MQAKRAGKAAAGAAPPSEEVAWLAGWLAAHAGDLRRAWLARLRAQGALPRAEGRTLTRDARRVYDTWVSAFAGASGASGPTAGAWQILACYTVEDAASMLLALQAVCRERLAEQAGRGDGSAAEALLLFEALAEPVAARAVAECAAAHERVLRDQIEALQSVVESRRRERPHSELLQRVITAQEEERKRVARELHDHTGQWLTSLMIGLRRLESMQCLEDGRSAIAEMRRNANRALQEIHHLTFELRPSVLDDLGVVVALQRYAEDFEKRTGIRLEVELEALAGVRLEPALETALYRIVQEALTNVAKHARATTASVLLQSRDDSLLLIVEDDGCGFVVPDAHVSNGKHYGLMGMQERVSLIGGKLTIESSPGAGTTVYVELPQPARQE